MLDRIKFFDPDLHDPDVSIHLCKGIDLVMHLPSKVGGIGYYTRHPHDVIEAN